MDQVNFSLQDEFYEEPEQGSSPNLVETKLTPKEGPKFCPNPNCRSTNIAKNGTVERQAMDLLDYIDLYEIPTHKRVTICTNRYICKECKRSFTQSFKSIDDRAKITNRLKQAIQNNCLTQQPKELSERYGVSLTTIKNITKEYIENKQKSWRPYIPSSLGMFEAKACGKKVVLCIDLERNGIVDILENGKKETLKEFFLQDIPGSHTPGNSIVTDFRTCKTITELSMDEDPVIEHPGLIIGKEFVCREINEAARKDIGSVGNLRNTLLKTNSKATAEERKQLDEALKKDKRLKKIHDVKENLLAIYAKDNRPAAEKKLRSVYDNDLSDCPALNALVDLIRDYEDEILAYHYMGGYKCNLLNARKLPEAVNKDKRYTFETLRARWLWSKENAVKASVLYTIDHSEAIIGLLKCVHIDTANRVQYFQLHRAITDLLAYYKKICVTSTKNTRTKSIPWLQFINPNILYDDWFRAIIADVEANSNWIEEKIGTYTDLKLLFEE